jgi:glycosyltransferase involved in cell wall biosynthesis
MSGIAALDAALTLDLPVVQTFHALGSVKKRHQGSKDSSPGTRVVHERRIIAEASRLIASCSDEAREIAALARRSAPVDIIPSGVDLDHFSPHGPALPRAAGFRLLTIGRLVPRKGVDDAIRAVALLPADTELVIAGGPDIAELPADPEAARLLALATELRVADRIRFVGRVSRPEIPELVRSSDAVLCLPWYEPFGIVPLEAMACGVPVIGTAVGGLLDTVSDGVTGLLVPPRDPVAVAAAAQRLLHRPRLRERMARAGRLRACGYGWDEVARRTEATYRRAVHAGVLPDPVAVEEVVG